MSEGCYRCGKPLPKHCKVYCSKACHQIKQAPRPCLTCGTVFTPRSSWAVGKYCSPPCQHKGQIKPAVTMTCQHCGITVTRPHYLKHKRVKFHSKACYWSSLRGRLATVP